MNQFKWVYTFGVAFFICLSGLQANLSPGAVSYFSGQPPFVEWHVYDPKSGEDTIYQKLTEMPVDIFWPKNDARVIFRVANEIFEAGWPKSSKATRVATIPSNLTDKVIRIWPDSTNQKLKFATYHGPYDDSKDVPAELKDYKEGYAVAVWTLQPKFKLEKLIPTESEKCDALGPDVIGKSEGGMTLLDRHLKSTPTVYPNAKWLSKKVEDFETGTEISGEVAIPAQSAQGVVLKAGVNRNWFELPFSVVSPNETTLYSLKRELGSFEPSINFDDRDGVLIINLHYLSPMEYQIVDLKSGKLLKTVKTPHEYHKKMSIRIPRLFWVESVR